jgi:septal ring factor EnvC (AmiA/AmiB activator)
MAVKKPEKPQNTVHAELTAKLNETNDAIRKAERVLKDTSDDLQHLKGKAAEYAGLLQYLSARRNSRTAGISIGDD